MGGEIGMRSKLDQGSLFWFEIPLKIGDVLIVVKKAAFDSVAVPPMHVLVTEDVEVNRDLLHATLTRHGHQVTLAENGAMAVELARHESSDVMLMDVQIPVMDGIEAAQQIRQLPSPAGQVPIVALTAIVMETERQRCLAAGMNHVVTKPVAWQDLFSTLATLSRQGSAAPCLPRTESPAPPSPPEAELVDRVRIDGLKEMAGEAKAASFLKNAVASAEQLTADISRLQDDPAEVVKLAHRLAGSAPSFGLSRISVLARSIEHRASDREAVANLVSHLEEAVVTTRQELTRLQLLPPQE